MCLVIKAVTNDKMQEVKTWVEKHFKKLKAPNKIDRQDFAEIATQ